jgi:dihydrofolate synthase/folylpolyglutamate synthase
MLMTNVDEMRGWLFYPAFTQKMNTLAIGLSTGFFYWIWNNNMQNDSLGFWLDKIKNQHRVVMDLGLDRVKQVANTLNLLKPNCPMIIVGGTNGKGSTVAGLEAIYLAAGYKVGAFTSPYLYKFNELVRINGKEVSDDDFIQAFKQIDEARLEMTLTQFEFNTLAALEIFKQTGLDIGILEVGLGGRLDAVNIIDADVSVITSIAIDHSEWLGNTREEIAIEKAGIFRSGKSAVCGDFDPPTTLLDYANRHLVPLFCQDEQFGFEQTNTSWTWWCEEKRFEHLPLSHLALQNMATALMAVDLMQDKLSVKREAIDKALATVDLPGRIQVIPGEITRILDVSHNPAATDFLANYLKKQTYSGKIRAVFSMLADKDIVSTLIVMRDRIDEWYIAPLVAERASSLSVLEYCFRTANIQAVNKFDSIKTAYAAALSASEAGDCVVVFGSFYTVAAAES